jgi:DMSO/TMAO reductase YedYZ molybdopterin-dependent catalytic subunit
MHSLGLVTRQKDPANLESRLDQIDSYVTPTELFYIRNHFPPPAIDRASYRLRIDGAVRHALTLTLDELKSMPSITRAATLECAGNGRVFLVPQVSGVQWELGAIGNAEWTGVPLAALLERAGPTEDACEFVLEGADRGKPNDVAAPAEPISFARSLSRDDALKRDVLVAYAMNGRDLPLDHGYPVRAVVPGHYGMASVKWLTRIEAVREPFRGYWQTVHYSYWDRLDGIPVQRALGEMKVKSEITRPRVLETVAPDRSYMVTGVAWAGDADVAEVAVSTDGGKSWAPATFLDPARRHSWRRWTFEWRTPSKPGRYTLLSRATATDGRVQPEQHDLNRGGYGIHHVLPIDVMIEDAGR